MMRFAVAMVLVAGVLPYLTTALAKSGGGYDNAAPRDWVGQLQGWRRRADFAHRNHFEAFPLFAAGVLIATIAGVSPARVDLLAGAYIVLRFIYTGVYIAGWATVRSIVWFGALLCVIGLFVSAV